MCIRDRGDTKPQGSATLKDTVFDIISLNDNSVLVEGKLYKKNEVVKTIRTDIEGVGSTSADLLPYGKFRIVESEAPNGYLTDGAKPIDFTLSLIHILFIRCILYALTQAFASSLELKINLKLDSFKEFL